MDILINTNSSFTGANEYSLASLSSVPILQTYMESSSSSDLFSARLLNSKCLDYDQANSTTNNTTSTSNTYINTSLRDTTESKIQDFLNNHNHLNNPSSSLSSSSSSSPISSTSSISTMASTHTTTTNNINDLLLFQSIEDITAMKNRSSPPTTTTTHDVADTKDKSRISPTSMLPLVIKNFNTVQALNPFENTTTLNYNMNQTNNHNVNDNNLFANNLFFNNKNTYKEENHSNHNTSMNQFEGLKNKEYYLMTPPSNISGDHGQLNPQNSKMMNSNTKENNHDYGVSSNFHDTFNSIMESSDSTRVSRDSHQTLDQDSDEETKNETISTTTTTTTTTTTPLEINTQKILVQTNTEIHNTVNTNLVTPMNETVNDTRNITIYKNTHTIENTINNDTSKDSNKAKLLTITTLEKNITNPNSNTNESNTNNPHNTNENTLEKINEYNKLNRNNKEVTSLCSNISSEIISTPPSTITNKNSTDIATTNMSLNENLTNTTTTSSSFSNRSLNENLTNTTTTFSSSNRSLNEELINITTSSNISMVDTVVTPPTLTETLNRVSSQPVNNIPNNDVNVNKNNFNLTLSSSAVNTTTITTTTTTNNNNNNNNNNSNNNNFNFTLDSTITENKNFNMPIDNNNHTITNNKFNMSMDNNNLNQRLSSLFDSYPKEDYNHSNNFIGFHSLFPSKLGLIKNKNYLYSKRNSQNDSPSSKSMENLPHPSENTLAYSGENRSNFMTEALFKSSPPNIWSQTFNCTKKKENPCQFKFSKSNNNEEEETLNNIFDDGDDEYYIYKSSTGGFYKCKLNGNDINSYRYYMALKNNKYNTENSNNYTKIYSKSSLTCSICSEKPDQFGLLTECDHIFCLDCIKVWRRTNMNSRELNRKCPVCQTVSLHFIPSDIYCHSGPLKKHIIERFRSRCSRIPCKFFERVGPQDSHSCPFGNSCLFSHKYPDGTDDKLLSEKKKEKIFSPENAQELNFYGLENCYFHENDEANPNTPQNGHNHCTSSGHANDQKNHTYYNGNPSPTKGNYTFSHSFRNSSHTNNSNNPFKLNKKVNSYPCHQNFNLKTDQTNTMDLFNGEYKFLSHSLTTNSQPSDDDDVSNRNKINHDHGHISSYCPINNNHHGHSYCRSNSSHSSHSSQSSSNNSNHNINSFGINQLNHNSSIKNKALNSFFSSNYLKDTNEKKVFPSLTTLNDQILCLQDELKPFSYLKNNNNYFYDKLNNNLKESLFQK